MVVAAELVRILIFYTGGTIGMQKDHNGERNKRAVAAEFLRILIIYTGGTIGMQISQDGVLSNTPGVFTEKVRNLLHDPELAKSFQLPSGVIATTIDDRMVTYNITEYEELLDSSNMGAPQWIQIAESIKSYYSCYDGFIVLHGTDTLTYTSSILSFLLEGLGKPVIVTGAQVSIFFDDSDAVDNIIGALSHASSGKIKEVCVYFGGKLLLGNRALKISNTAFEGFFSPNYPELNKNDIIPPESDSANIGRKTDLVVHTTVNPNVTLIHLYPNIRSEMVEKMLAPPIQGAVLLSFGAGNIPHLTPNLLQTLKNATENGVFIINVSQVLQGGVSSAYEAGHVLLEAGIIPGGDMTVEAAYTKMCFVLGLSVDRSTKVMLLKTNIRGEMTPLNTHKL